MLNALWCELIRPLNECLVSEKTTEVRLCCFICLFRHAQGQPASYWPIFSDREFSCSDWYPSQVHQHSLSFSFRPDFEHINCSSCSVAAFTYSVEKHTPVRSGKGHVNPNLIKRFETSVHFHRKKHVVITFKYTTFNNFYCLYIYMFLFLLYFILQFLIWKISLS